jgi:hypothetical protein
MWITRALAADGVSLPLDVAQAGSKLVTEGGLIGTLLFLALAAISVLYIDARFRNKEDRNTIKEMQKAHDDERDLWAKQAHDVNNERFKEWREILTAISTSTAALQVISQNQADRSQTSNEIAKAIQELITINKGIQASLDRNHGEMGKIKGLITRRSGASLEGPQ